VVEGVKAVAAMNGWIMDEDRMNVVRAKHDIPIGHKVALKDMAVGDTVVIDRGTVVQAITAREHSRQSA
jgi:(2R)-sulfolactate sulfo-lyase subunit alpha